jgi:uncharacterized protein YbaA (DUF1428 family)
VVTASGSGEVELKGEISVAYVDGFVLPLPKKHLAAYRKMARAASKIWRDHGALDYRECAGEDLNPKGVLTFPKAFKLKPGETVVFAWIMYKSRAHRDRVNAKVMKDPRCHNLAPGGMPFDIKRMVYGGFESIVSF